MYVVSDRLELTNDREQARCELLAGLCHSHALRAALEERRLDILLKVLDLAADSGRRYVQPLSCLADPSAVGRLEKVTQRADLHDFC